MDIKEHLEKINAECQHIFAKTIVDYTESLGKSHHLSACIFEYSEYIFDKNEKELLSTVSAQIESSTLNAALGLYRQSFSSLRLAFEMALGCVSFSVDKLEHYEWLNGKTDIIWAKLIAKDNGVLSTRFSNAFFQDLSPYISEFNERASKSYRTLSEFVHGNNETWTKSGIQLKFNKDLADHYFEQLFEIGDIILFSLSCRYLKSIAPNDLETMEFLSTQFSHLEPIRVLFGGPKS